MGAIMFNELLSHPASEDSSRNGIALCLSGGGFRASLFHLGALRRLHELGILPQLRWISCVSGGSILAAHLATRMVKERIPNGGAFTDWEVQVSAPFRRITARDLRTWPVVAHLLWNWLWPQWRVLHMERRYKARLTDLLLQDLPADPLFIFCATDITFGVNWEFSRARVGDYQAGYVTDGASWTLARAVNASASFPPVFGPMRVPAKPETFRKGSYRGTDRAKILKNIQISDGGVYDNMGLEPVWDNARWVLVSDCGAPFEFSVGNSVIHRLLRYTSVVTSQTRALRIRKLMADFQDTSPQRKYGGAYWHLGSRIADAEAGEPPIGYSQELVNDVIAAIRTDLDAFTDAEARVLENHGYMTADRQIRRRVPALIANATVPLTPPFPEWLDEAKVRYALRNSHKRFSIQRLMETFLRRSN
jgi:NTE family protein